MTRSLPAPPRGCGRWRRDTRFEFPERIDRTQKRHDDTVLFLDAIIEDGLDSSGGRYRIEDLGTHV